MTRKHRYTPGGRTLVTGVAAAVPFLITFTASAEEQFWLDAAASTPVPVNGPYNADFGQGFAGALGGYGSLVPQLSLGARVGAGFIEEDDHVNLTSGDLDFGTLSGAVRVRPFASRASAERSTGFWLEAAGGGALLEDQLRPAIEPGLGYNFATDILGIGPFGRYTQIVETENQFGGDDARLVMVGLELTLLDGRTKEKVAGAERAADRRRAEATLEMERRQVMAERERMRQREAELQKQRDDLEAQREALEQRQKIQPVAAEEPEAIVLDERLFFDYDSAELHESGKTKLEEIAKEFNANRQTWRVIRVQGYADRSGSERHNLRLSAKRAMAAHDYLVSVGIPEQAVKAEAYGEEWPLIEGASTPTELQQNRNVSFVIVLGDKGTERAAEIKPPAAELEEERRIPVRGMEEGEPMQTPGREEEPK